MYFLDNCCCKSILELKSAFVKKEKSDKSIHKQNLIQLTMLNNSYAKLCKSIKNLDHKI